MQLKTFLLFMVIYVSCFVVGTELNKEKITGKLKNLVEQLQGCMEDQSCVKQFTSILANADWPTKSLEFQLENTETAEECMDQAAEFCVVDGVEICSENMPPTWISCDGSCIAYVEAAPNSGVLMHTLKALTNSDHVQFVEYVEEVHTMPRLIRQAQVGESHRPAEFQFNEARVSKSQTPWWDRENYVASKERPIGKKYLVETGDDFEAFKHYLVETDDGFGAFAACEDLGHTWGLSALDGAANNNDDYVSSSNDGTGVFVYVLDTGFFGGWNGHEEFAGRVDKGKSFINGESVNDLNDHGTHCAGTIGSKSYGVAKNVKIIPVKVLSNQGSGSSAGVIGGMEWVLEDAKARGAPLNKVLMSMSLGGGKSEAENNVVNSLVDAGVTIVVAAGNENSDACSSSPASAEKAITVGSTTSSNAKSGFSNWGTCVDILAPGSSILSTISGMKTASFSGTSMACPHVAGVVASMYSRCDAMSPSDVMAKFASMDGYSVQNAISGFSSNTPNIFVQNSCGEDHCGDQDLSYWMVDPIDAAPSTTSGPKFGCGNGLCGSNNSAEQCYCDDACKQYGDCCYNYDDLCCEGCNPTPSTSTTTTTTTTSTTSTTTSGKTGCAGLCGSSNGAEKCYCDNACKQYGDCCSNYDEFCCEDCDPTKAPEPTSTSTSTSTTTTKPQPSVRSGCAGYCDAKNSDEGCWCDSLCQGYGDCCSNYDLVCGLNLGSLLEAQQDAKVGYTHYVGDYDDPDYDYDFAVKAAVGDNYPEYDYEDYQKKTSAGRNTNTAVKAAVGDNNGNPFQDYDYEYYWQKEKKAGRKTKLVEAAVGDFAVSNGVVENNNHTLYVSSGVVALILISCIVVYYACNRKPQIDARTYLLAGEDCE